MTSLEYQETLRQAFARQNAQDRVAHARRAALVPYDTQVELWWDARLLCEVCQEHRWTQVARSCDALVCRDCASSEPNSEEE